MKFNYKVLIHILILPLGSSTLPRTASRATDTEGAKVTNATSSTSIYDNVATGNQSMQGVGQGKLLSNSFFT